MHCTRATQYLSKRRDTTYATGPAPIYFGSGYISRKEFWTLGLLFGLLYLFVLLARGLPHLLATSR